MNLKQLVNTINKASIKSEQKMGKNPFRFNHLNPRQQEAVIEGAAKVLNRNPFDTDLDKQLLNAINERMHNAKFMNNIRNGEDLSELSSVLDRQADDILATGKISKDLEDYTTIPLNYEDKYNRVNLSKFVDEEGDELSQSQALDQIFYNEGIENINRGTFGDALLDAIKEQRKNPLDRNRIEYDWLQKAINDYKEDALLRYNINPYRTESLRTMYKKYKDINTKQPATGWENLGNETTKPGSLTVYSKKQSDPFVSKYNNQYLPLKYYQDKIDVIKPNENELNIKNILYKTGDDAQRLYNELDLPGFTEELDSITGQPVNEITKNFELDPYYEEAPLVPERTYKKGTKLYELQQKRLNR